MQICSYLRLLKDNDSLLLYYNLYMTKSLKKKKDNKMIITSVCENQIVPAIAWGDPGVDGAELKLLLLWSDG